MRCRLSLIMVFLLVAFTAASTLSASNAYAASFTQENRPENLKALWELILQSHYVKHDSTTATALLRGIIPDQSRILKAIKDGVPPDVAPKIAAKFQEFGLPSEASLDIFLPVAGGSVTVYGATTEELAAFQEGSMAAKYFPKGAQKAAQQILRPKMTFYQVVVSVPKENSRVTYHMLYWDGRQWTMLARPWEVLK